MNKQQKIDFNASKYSIDIRVYSAPSFWKNEVINNFNAYLLKNKTDYKLNATLPVLEFGYCSIKFEGTEHELDELLTILNANEKHFKILGVHDHSKTIAEIYNDTGAVKIRENYWRPDATVKITPEKAAELLTDEDRQRYKQQSRVLFWIDKRKLDAIIYGPKRSA